MINLHEYIKSSGMFKKLVIDDLLFVEYKCVVDEVKAGIWSPSNYFVFVTSGKKMWRSIYGEYVVESGDSLFVKKGANLVHQYFDEDYCALMVFISDDFICKFMNRFHNLVKGYTKDKDPGDSVLRVQTDAFLEGYVSSLVSFFSSPVNPDIQLLKLKFEELLLNIFTRPLHREVARYMASLNKGHSVHLEQVMETNFAYNLKLEQYAELCHMSLSSFKRAFASHYGTSPGKWLSNKRLDFASHLLRSSDMNVNQVAFESGFEDTTNFIRAFKHKFSETPLQFRSSQD